MKRLFAIALCLASFCCPASAQFKGGGGFGAPGFTSPSVISGSTYQGPVDAVSGATMCGSLARACTAAYANGSNPLADLVDATTGTVAICTLRAATTGFVDLSGSYCTGSTTPAVACAAAAGGLCRVTKIYDQTGNSNHCTNATASTMPTVTFNLLNGLPGINGVAANNTVLTCPSFTQAQPFSMSVVAERTAVAQYALLGASGGPVFIGFGGSANQSAMATGETAVQTAADNAFHSIQGVGSNTIGAINTDGTDSGSLAIGTTTIASTLRLLRSNGAQSTTGSLMEYIYYPAALNSTQRAALTTNQHSTNGYCATNGCTF